MKFSIMQFVGIISVLIFTISPVWGQGSVLVKTEDVFKQSFHDQISLIGRTAARISSNIVSEISGRVASVNTPEGTWAKTRQPLITIDSERLSLSLKAMEAETEQARLQAELASSDRERTIELRKQNLVSETALDSAVAWEAIQAARYRQLDADRAKLAYDFESSIIRAPFSGYTGRQLIDVGEWVEPGQAVYEMVDLSVIKITVDLPERYFGHLQIGSAVTVTVSNDTEKSISGRVTGISPNASSETHTFPVIIEVKNSNGRLAGGMLVRTTLFLNEQFTSLAVSKDAIVRQGNQIMIYTIDEGKASPIPVTIKSTEGDNLAVESQMLQIGMPVVIRGNERIYPGAAVTTGEEPEQPVTPDSQE